MWIRGFSIIAAGLVLSLPLPAGRADGAEAAKQAAATADAPADEVDEIVVTARRSGIPVWRVDGPGSGMVLVGAIDGVSKTTRWGPGSLSGALLKADRVMFPDTVGITGSPFAMVGYMARWRKQATLPKGQSLTSMLRPEQFARLASLQRRGLLRPGFERKHPLHLALMLRDIAKGKAGYGPGAGQYVRQTARKHKLKLVPIARSNAKPWANDLFKSRPETHVPCLLASLALVEAGPGAVKARSDAWAERRVAEVLNSPAEKVYDSCWPAVSSVGRRSDADILASLRNLLNDPQSTIAVISLDSLARSGGLLDRLRVAGYEVRGPAWRN